LGFEAEHARHIYGSVMKRDADQRIILSQAAAIRGANRNFARNGKPCKGIIDMLHNSERKSKAKKVELLKG
jgi:hypothetical protein